jgi:DNA-binding protein HU-beta
MNKVVLSEKIADKFGYKKKQSFEIVEYMIKVVQEALANGEKVQLIPFGTFEIKERRARTGRNPKTNARVEIKARKVVAFRTGKSLKNAIN